MRVGARRAGLYWARRGWPCWVARRRQHTGIAPDSLSPDIRAPITSSEVQDIVRMLENDPRILMETVAHLDPNNRRRLVVTGGAMEWFGEESAAQEVEKADIDKDRRISPKDFDHWFESALKRRQEGHKRRTEQRDVHKREVPQDTDGGKAVPFSGLLLIALEAALPFVGFGFFDNATMILVGDAIDSSLGFYLNCSVLASAAMGNVCSGMMGMQVHGVIDSAVQKLHFNTPVLSEAQMTDRRVFLAGHMGGTLGILIGLILGMTPLFFIGSDDDSRADYLMFRRWDRDGSGRIELGEFEKMLSELGLHETDEMAKSIIEKYGGGKAVSFKQFSRLMADVRNERSVFE